ncbi:hypothetical protein FIV42_24550 [Persicimonas caeni]|uniref:Type II toxin-antitoxin system ParD family antitoxin n=1 Tax=Persicimonas caeni TaxID=2292766 RepID=A0A4Y6Q0N9_PERCE|nr:type II toxin-antitoxin system ParD family antitoxin [Persicimonas caeni]QDG53797.1 hypothetical protein FIV42_24550 [Persicimonas caeni]QED35018.1 hypothetical protein FRD00_24545 [Persicimonas caeni]
MSNAVRAEPGGRGRPRPDGSEAVRAGVRLLEDQVREREAKLQLLRKAVEQGVVELDHGEGIPGDKVFGQLLAGLHEGEDSP